MRDTNIWVSAALNPAGTPAAVAQAFRDGRFVSVSCSEVLDELREVLTRPRIRRRLRLEQEAVEAMLALVQRRWVMVFPPGELRVSRDPKDDLVLETGIAGRARYVVSRDDDIKRDLQVIARLREHGIEAVSVTQFMEILSAP